eukprot:m.738068 g.738068  ORF g.738068 m.738068 type:complete len:151 (-) comp23098_c1_seq87:64-516(-)
MCRSSSPCLWPFPCVDVRHGICEQVVSFCSSVAAKAKIAYNGDPLRDFALARFLDKFVFKKPKAKASDKGGSVMQPKHSLTQDTTEVNSEQFLKQDISQIPVDQQFYHRCVAPCPPATVSIVHRCAYGGDDLPCGIVDGFIGTSSSVHGF